MMIYMYDGLLELLVECQNVCHFDLCFTYMSICVLLQMTVNDGTSFACGGKYVTGDILSIYYLLMYM